MKNLLKVSLLSLTIGLFASCGEAEKAADAATNVVAEGANTVAEGANTVVEGAGAIADSAASKVEAKVGEAKAEVKEAVTGAQPTAAPVADSTKK